MPEKSIVAGRHKWRELLVIGGLAPSKSEAERLLRQRAVKRDGVVVEGGEVEAAAPASFVVSVGASRFVRFRVESA
jgi:tyrosyl-tRNA synthetase